MRLNSEDLHALNQTSVSLGSGGYLGMFGVYHELHCMVCEAHLQNIPAFKRIAYMDRNRSAGRSLRTDTKMDYLTRKLSNF